MRILVKTLIVVILAAATGYFIGWSRNNAHYGDVSAFGPFTDKNDLTVSGLAGYWKSQTQIKSPRIEIVGSEEYDFGVMEAGSKGKHKFVVRNAGEFPLALEIIGSTCKCTIGELTKSSIDPGEQTEIELSWNVVSTGEEFGQSAILKTNDPSRGELNLKIKGRVVSEMTMSPKSFDFGTIEASEAVKLESVIYSFLKEPIVVLKPKLTDETIEKLSTFTIEEIPVEAKEGTRYANAVQAFKIVGEIQPGLPQGSVKQNFGFQFTAKSAVDGEGNHKSEDERSFFVPITGKIVGAITLVESSRCKLTEAGDYLCSMGTVDPAKTEPQRINVMLRGKYKDTLKLNVGKVEPSELLHAELGEAIGRGNVTLYPLRIWIDLKATFGSRTGKNADDYGIVWIETDNPEVPPLPLKVLFTVAKE